MITKIKRQEALSKFPVLPLTNWDAEKEEFIDSFPDSFGNYVLTVNSKSYRGHINTIASQIITLTRELKSESLIFLCASDTTWRYRDHEFIKAKEGLQYLADSKIGKKFNGALMVNIPELQSFLKHICWLIRTNAVISYIYFIDINQNFFATICQYGNLHLSTITAESDKRLKQLLLKTELKHLDRICFNQFSRSSKITGRDLSV